MRAVVQRVKKAAVVADGELSGSIGPGLMVLLGIHESDTPAQASWIAEKLVKLRIFQDEEGKMNRSIEDMGGSILLVSQFTLYGDLKKGTRPSFIEAARPEVAIPLYESVIKTVRGFGVPVETGVFGAHMEVELVNDGPVTIIVER